MISIPVFMRRLKAQNIARFECFVKSRSIGMQFSFGCVLGRWGQRITHTPGTAAN